MGMWVQTIGISVSIAVMAGSALVVVFAVAEWIGRRGRKK